MGGRGGNGWGMGGGDRGGYGGQPWASGGPGGGYGGGQGGGQWGPPGGSRAPYYGMYFQRLLMFCEAVQLAV